WGVVRGHAVSAQERGASPAIGDRVNRLERQLEDLRGTLKIPGISAAVVKDQRLLWVKGFGSAAAEHTTTATPQTNYRIASLTKPFASTLLMQLVERGKLDLDEPMAKYSPEFRQRFGRGAITVRHVLTHTSHDPSGDTYWYDGKGKGVSRGGPNATRALRSSGYVRRSPPCTEGGRTWDSLVSKRFSLKART